VGRRKTRVIDPSGSASVFPAEPVEPGVFVEDVIPALFADLDLSPAQRAVELRLGIVLQGEADAEARADSGGEWTLHFVDGELGIETGRSPDCDLTLVQSVADWRAALWSGQPPLVADALRRGDTGPRFHALTRPPRAEGEAAARAVALAEIAGAPVFIYLLRRRLA